ncbi:hypothetical protein V6N12_009674 [Hibiscus sabdariffa]|uniref:DUF4283 domain-containing protein n=1 Tax=Hibiscus sabdariffa TaxID=183260 RepID=A0ABR2BUX4_9ROSI
MECEDQSNQRPLLPYKDIVSGGNGTSPVENNLDFDDDDIELLEDDIVIGDSNGITSIDFSERVQLFEGPWTIFGHYLTVEPWSIDFQPSHASPSRLMAWIHLPVLPVTLYKRSFIKAIGNQIGNVIKINFQTDNSCRGRFARMAVSINLKKPLVSKLMINGRLQIIEYESLPTVCFNYGIYGHLQDICPKNKVPSNDCPMNRETVQVVPAPVEAPAPVDPYGPWMLVEKRRRNSRTLSIVNPVTTVDPNIAPVVNPLFEPTNAPPVTLPLIQESNLDSSNDMEVSFDYEESFRYTSRFEKSVVVASKSVKSHLPTHAIPMHGSRGLSRNDASSLRLQQNLSKPTILDPVKHQAVKHLESANPPIPLPILTGSQQING